MNPRVIEVKPEKDFLLMLTFSNGYLDSQLI